MAFPPQFLDEIRTRVPLSSVVGRKVRLTRAGREWKSPCPFHKEKTPSFYVNDQKGFFHCFGCGAHGDAVGFLMRHDNLSFIESVELLAAEAGMEVPKPTEAERQRYEAQKTQHEVLEAATVFFEEQLRKPGGRKALEYLKSRGLDEQTIAQFRLGYAPADAQALKAALVAAGAKEPDLIELGLLKQAEDGGRTYAFFRDRVIFPVTDRRGRPVAFGARLIEGEGPKYINSPEHALFHKGETVYGIARARLAAAEGAPIVIAEGYMDVIALVRAGYPGAVAPMGTAITEAQVEALWKLIPAGLRAPILCLDGDNAGQRAAERAVSRVLPILKPDHTLKIAFMPSGEDPDSLQRAGGAPALAKVLEQAIPLSEMLWRSTLAQKPGQTPEEQAGLRAFLLDRVSTIGDGLVREEYRRDMLRRLGDKSYGGRRAMAGSFRRPQAGGMFRPWQKGKPPPPYGPKPAQRPGSARDMRARALLSVMVRHPFLFEEFCEAFHNLAVPEKLRGLHGAICEALGERHDLDAAGLQAYLAGKGHSESLAAILHRNVRLHSGFAGGDMTPEQVREGWISMLASDGAPALMEDIRRAQAEFAANMDEANLLKLRMLQAQLTTAKPLDGEVD